jgi:S-adenosylmethionine synthetase
MQKRRAKRQTAQQRQTKRQTAQQRQTKRQTKRQKGGFIPSVMEGFCAATSKYVVPITLLLAHKLLRAKTEKRTRKRR